MSALTTRSRNLWDAAWCWGRNGSWAPIREPSTALLPYWKPKGAVQDPQGWQLSPTWAVKPEHCLSQESGQWRAGGPFAQWQRSTGSAGWVLVFSAPLEGFSGWRYCYVWRQFFPSIHSTIQSKKVILFCCYKCYLLQLWLPVSGSGKAFSVR